jgi:hypothetical protein
MHWNVSGAREFCKLIAAEIRKSAQPGIIPQKTQDGAAVAVPRCRLKERLADSRGHDLSCPYMCDNSGLSGMTETRLT